ncbi:MULTISPECIES: SDR family NAD(P)-dependent oxidoreductase [unclassified Gilliamella]|uniref:SDR family NAD(P)-dependent oxidoreductase n=1 Tax=unclassified Gilliamella TaxID=2685620 RepID=UPI001C69B385|nr:MULTISPECIES: SDR family oxidoreductase [unclassified Gilliamella]MCX8640538.1 SDR family oxidoreductase [Gilliamella sp. B3172]QYN47712.1 SDR family oxidoreductase [Gilliamella sp. ESL0405]
MSQSWLGLENDVCVVTGAMGGMGLEICREFAKQKANLVLIDLDEAKCQQFAKELTKQYGIQAIGIACNTTIEEQVDAAVAEVKQVFGRCDVLVNTAAILRFCPIEDLPLDEWKTTVNINLTGYFLMSQRFGRLMIEQKSGRMVHISTVASHTPETYSGAYSPTKAGVSMLSKQFAAEWGQFGIRSNAVCPCFVKTPLSRKFYEDKEVEQGRTRMIASRRIGETIDIANAVLYLASKRSDYSNGTELVVDGGYEVMLGDLVPRPGGRRQFAIEQHAALNANKK